MSADVLPSSFRDPSGFVFRRDGTLYRQVNESFRERFDAFVESGLYDALVADGLLVAHEEVDASAAATPDAYKVLRPDLVPFVSYPYEWCPGQLREAALLTLRAQQAALAKGMTLRDASAYNVQFRDGRPILIDTLSFEPATEGAPWAAYRQFCQHFLAPLALAQEVDPRLTQLTRIHLDGVPLDLASALLPFGTRMRPGLYTHLHLHARAQKRYADAVPKADGRKPSMSPQALRGLLDSLEGTVRRLEWQPSKSTWSDYYDEGASYQADAIADKEAIVRALLDVAAPATVWDLGGNTGRFSRLAAARGAHTVSFDLDVAAVEANWQQVVAAGETRLLPLVLDLTNPSPAIGWGNDERMSLAERGPVDLVLVLAVVHHLAIGNNVPLSHVASYLAELATWAIVEFVPKSDAMVQRLLATREDIFPDYTQDGFEQAFGAHFTVERREPVRGSERLVYLLRSR